MCRRRRVCLRQQTTAMRRRRQLPAVQFNRSRMAQPSRRRNIQTALCETLTPRAASSSFSLWSVRCGVWLIRSLMKVRCEFQHRLAVPAHLAGRHRAGRAIALRPLHHRRHRNAKPRRHRPAALATHYCRNHTLTQIIGKRSAHQMLAPSPARILNHKPTRRGTPVQRVSPI